MNGSEKKVREILALAGLEPNGPHPWDPKIHDERIYARAFSGGSLAIGEAYMDGWWDSDDLTECFARAIRAQVDKKIHLNLETLLRFAYMQLANPQKQSRAHQVAKVHYDIGNDLYKKMLGPSMSYSCGYWKEARTLDEAQYAKFDLICRKMNLQKGQQILEIGCGFGSFAKYAAEHYGVSVVGVSVSKEQVAFAREYTKELPIEIRLEDYRKMTGSFDHVVSIAMFEAVGYKNYRTFMEKVHELLKPDGLFLLHTIGGNDSVSHGDPWIEKYIFPNGMLPSIAQIGTSIEKIFVMEDWHNFGADYDRTLIEWFKNFDAAWPELKETYGDTFYPMWKYYLLICAAGFRCRQTQLWQIVLSKQGLLGGYSSVR